MKRIKSIVTAMFIGALIICFSLNTITVFAESSSVAINDISMATVRGVSDEVNVSLNNIQEPVLTLNGKQLALNTDYVVWYYNTSSVGTAKILIIGIGNYTGYIEKEYKITGTYNINIGESIEIPATTPVQIEIADSFDEIEILYDQEKLITLNAEEAKSFFCKSYLFAPKNDDIDGVANWTISQYDIHQYTVPYWNGSHIVNRVVKERVNVVTTQITALDSSVKKLSWLGIPPIVHKSKIFVQPDIYPTYSYDQELTWKSSDESVAIVDDFGVVTIVKPGKCKIIVSTSNGLSIKQELDIEAMDISKVATVTPIRKNTNEYDFVLSDKYGVMICDSDYEVSYDIKNNIIYATFNGIGLYGGTLTKYFDVTNNLKELSREELPYKFGDLDENDVVTDADAEYLLMYTFFPEDYPVNQECDFNGDGKVNDADAEHLLMYTFFPEDYPLN